MTSESRLCECHGEPMLFQRDSRYRLGGFFRCAVRSRARSRAYYEANRERVTRMRRVRYDTDPIHRISKRLADDRRRRAQTLAARKEKLTEEG